MEGQKTKITVSLAVCGVVALLLFGKAVGSKPLRAQEVHARPFPEEAELSNVAIPMRDGVLLRADVILPAGNGPWPAVLVRTPYDRRSKNTRGHAFLAGHGYAVVVQDVRGRNGSAGTFGSIAQEGPDGSDTVDWIARQPWSNGRVGMTGASYVGIDQWWAAVQHNPHLVTIFPMVSGDDEYMDRYYSPGGALKLGHRLIWLSENLTPRGTRTPAYSDYIRHLPLKSSDIVATTQEVDIWRIPLEHPSYDRFWQKLSIRQRLADLNIPVSSVGGWFDNYAESDLDAFSRLAKRGVPVETWIGPWSHTFTINYPTINFGTVASLRIRTWQLQWFDRFLKTPETSGPYSPTLHIFVMGADTWREEHEWPLARTKFTPYYLDSHGQANTADGDGELLTYFGSDHPPDRFVYDPQNPVPTRGGAICCNPELMPPGPLEQTAVEKRKDVLVYTSRPLHDEMEVTGPVAVTAYVSTSANDTDFTAKLVDVFPDGRRLLVTDGIARLRYRVSLIQPVFVKHNMPYQIHIDAGVTSWVFAPGHRIRLEISSSNFPRFDRNLNSSRPNADEIRITRAFQTVYHERKYPSVLVLPVIPRVRSSSYERDSHSRANYTVPGVH